MTWSGSRWLSGRGGSRFRRQGGVLWADFRVSLDLGKAEEWAQTTACKDACAEYCDARRHSDSSGRSVLEMKEETGMIDVIAFWRAISPHYCKRESKVGLPWFGGH